MPADLVRYVSAGSSYLGNPVFQGPVTLEFLQQMLTGGQPDASDACASGSADATRNCN